jgi:cytosine/adenosine deaminase-related metal-dependent hydrolase
VSPQPPLISTAGFIDAHSHLRSTALEDQAVPGASLEESLLRMMAMTSVPVFEDTFVACSDLISSGVTGVQVMFHTFGDAEAYLETLDQTIAGIEHSGIRALIILSLTDQAEFGPLGRKTPPLPEWASVQRGITVGEFPEIFAEAIARHPGINFGVGPVGPQWASDELLEVVAGISSSGLRIHTHCMESILQKNWAQENPVSRLERHGLLGPETSLAHGVWLDSDDLDVIAQSGAHIVTCPHSNRILNAGLAPVSQWLHHKIPVAIGIDSSMVPPLPYRTARMALDHDHALQALTTDGQSATGLDTRADSVTWSELESSEVWELSIGGRVLIHEGLHLLRDDIDQARARISRIVATDREAREARHTDISRILPAYLAALA